MNVQIKKRPTGDSWQLEADDRLYRGQGMQPCHAPFDRSIEQPCHFGLHSSLIVRWFD